MNETIINKRICNKSGKIILHESRHWLVEQYDESLYNGAYFAIPIWHENDKYDTRPAGANWCYCVNGAKEIDVPKEMLQDIYMSHLEKLNRNLNFYLNTGPSGGSVEREIQFTKDEINYYKNLLDEL